MSVAPHLQLAAVLLAGQLAVVVHAGAHAVGVVRVGDHEGDVALLGGEVPAGLRAAGVHDHGVRLLQRVRAAHRALDLVVAALEVEGLLLGPRGA